MCILAPAFSVTKFAGFWPHSAAGSFNPNTIRSESKSEYIIHNNAVPLQGRGRVKWLFILEILITRAKPRTWLTERKLIMPRLSIYNQILESLIMQPGTAPLSLSLSRSLFLSFSVSVFVGAFDLSPRYVISVVFRRGSLRLASQLFPTWAGELLPQPNCSLRGPTSWLVNNRNHAENR